MRAIVERIEAFATGGGGGEASDASAVEEQPQAAMAPEQPRVARVEIAKPQAIVRPAPQAKVAAPVAPVSPVQKADDKAAKKADAAHTRLNKSDWRPFDKPLADDELSRRVDNEMAAQCARLLEDRNLVLLVER